MRKAAAALDCRLVYALVPNTSLEQMVSDRSRGIAARDLARITQTMALEDQAVSAKGFEEEIEAYVRDHIRDKDLWAKR